MSRKGFLLGFFATAGQVLLLRELVSSLNGDELFIGTSLFGWLIWVALGSYLGGKRQVRLRSRYLFITGIITLPIAIIATRLSPLVATDVSGEIVPLVTGGLVSVIVVLPLGIISGALFPAIVRESGGTSGSLIRTYLLEGIGACFGGATIMLMAGSVISTLGMSLILGLVVIVGLHLTIDSESKRQAIVLSTAAIAVTVVIAIVSPSLDTIVDGLIYRSYRIEESFDTPYGRQIILSRDSTLTLVTDNTIEGTTPDLVTAENLLIPPLIYRPDARKILLIGRSELGIAQLADKLPGLAITAVDPRQKLTRKLGRFFSSGANVSRVDDDPMAFLARAQLTERFDIIIINGGDLGSYKNSRFFTESFLLMAKASMQQGGIVYVPTHYDTERHVSAEEAKLLAIIHNVLKQFFGKVAFWPGNMTLFFASDAPVFDIPYDSLIARISHLGYAPQFINDNYLYDRLSSLRSDRLRNAVDQPDWQNSINRPTLPLHQAFYRARASAEDRVIASLILKNTGWMIIIPLLVVIFFVLAAALPGRKERFGLFLYFVAGLTSLTLELVSFYVYQTTAGSLYSEMAALIGAFMLGLAAGAYFTTAWARKRAEYGALALLLISSLFFLATYSHVPRQGMLWYHVLFLFTVAVGTGSLFVAATHRYYQERREGNSGVGYASELVGSAIGALLPMTLLLPLIGLHWLLVSLIILLVLAMLGSLVTEHR